MKKCSTILWDSSSDNPNIFSISDCLEKNSNVVRQIFLEFIESLGEKKILKTSIYEFLKIDNNFSLWSLSRIIEKCPFKDNNIPEILKVLTFVKYYNDFTNYDEIVFYEVTNKATYKVLKKFLDKKIKYNFSNCKISNVENDSIIYNILNSVRFFFILLINSIFLKNKINDITFKNKKILNFFSYFIHLDMDLLKKNEFYSYQWTVLFNSINNFYDQINIFHHYTPSKLFKSVRQVNNISDNLNKNKTQNYNHIIINSFFNTKLVFFSFIKYFKIILQFSKINKFRTIFFHEQLKVDLWPLYKKQFYISLYGSSLFQNIIVTFYFKNTLSKLPIQKSGYYLYEGQSWERALCYYWKHYNFKNLIGVAHSTIRFWDLRYHFCKESFSKSFLHPDKIILNGKMQYKELISSNYPKNKIINAEALRYLHLKKNKISINKKIKHKKIKIVILGDIIYEYTYNMIRLIADSIEKFKDFELYLKFHPGNIFEVPNKIKKNIIIINNKMSEIICEFDIAIGSCSGSANLEFFLSGKPIYIYKDPKQLNLSPLRSNSNVKFFQNKNQLAKILKIKYPEHNLISMNDYFNLDDKIPKWKEIIKKYS